MTAKVLGAPSAYSWLAVLPDGSKKHACETITFARFPLEWLTGG
jgi:hypothetical protein